MVLKIHNKSLIGKNIFIPVSSIKGFFPLASVNRIYVITDWGNFELNESDFDEKIQQSIIDAIYPTFCVESNDKINHDDVEETEGKYRIKFVGVGHEISIYCLKTGDKVFTFHVPKDEHYSALLTFYSSLKFDMQGPDLNLNCYHPSNDQFRFNVKFIKKCKKTMFVEISMLGKSHRELPFIQSSFLCFVD